MNRLAILDDNLEFSRKLLNYIVDKNRKIQLLSLAITGEEILESVEKLTNDDILLLDLGLPTINGIEVLEKLIQNKPHLPHIIIMSGNEKLLKQIRPYLPYIHEVLQKPFDFEKMLETIEKIIFNTEQKCYEILIKKELLKFEINSHTKGYEYIVDAIQFVLYDKTLIKNLKTNLFELIASKYEGVTANNVKWTLEKSVTSVVRYTSTKVLREYFYIEAREKLAPKLFIGTIAENLRNEIEKEKEEVHY